jgi:hypothetical protein
MKNKTKSITLSVEAKNLLLRNQFDLQFCLSQKIKIKVSSDTLIKILLTGNNTKFWNGLKTVASAFWKRFERSNDVDALLCFVLIQYVLFYFVLPFEREERDLFKKMKENFKNQWSQFRNQQKNIKSLIRN